MRRCVSIMTLQSNGGRPMKNSHIRTPNNHKFTLWSCVSVRPSPAAQSDSERPKSIFWRTRQTIWWDGNEWLINLGHFLRHRLVKWWMQTMRCRRLKTYTVLLSFWHLFKSHKRQVTLLEHVMRSLGAWETLQVFYGFGSYSFTLLYSETVRILTDWWVLQVAN